MLEVIGKTLRALSLGLHSFSEDQRMLFDIKDIFNLCPFLTDLDVGEIPSWDRLHLDKVELVYLYGTQLNSISDVEESLPNVMLQKIAERCRNAAFPHAVFETECFKVLSVLGPQIQRMFDSPGFESQFSAYFTSLSTEQCNVEHITIGLRNAKVYFAVRRPKLKILDLHFNRLEDDDVMDIAENSGGLRIISFWGSRVSPHALETLARANKSIEKVTVRMSGAPTDDAYAAYMMDRIDCFLDCQHLKQISVLIDSAPDVEVSWQTAVADKCLIVRNRNVSISIKDVRYLF